MPVPPIRYPADLPITARRSEIVAAIRDHQVVILAGETGSGKTTQLPKMCLEALGTSLRGQIGCTQPRRVAAMSVSRRVAEELGVQWGHEVGCKMRFNDDTRRDTLVKFMTDGILLAEIQSDPQLRHYSLLILDEAHERSLNIDFLLGYLKTLLAKRDPTSNSSSPLPPSTPKPSRRTLAVPLSSRSPAVFTPWISATATSMTTMPRSPTSSMPP
jgi:ATP-dependent helicase HrpA